MSNLTESEFNYIKALKSWPKSIVYIDSGIEEKVSDESVAETALMVTHSPKKTSSSIGELIIQWAVFVPLEEERFSYQTTIDGLGSDYLILLHSQFFFDSGRMGITEMDSLHKPIMNFSLLIPKTL